MFLVVLYMIYRDTEERHIKSLQEQAKQLESTHKEQEEFKKYYYQLKDKFSLMEKELEIYKKDKIYIDKKIEQKSKNSKSFPPDDLIAF